MPIMHVKSCRKMKLKISRPMRTLTFIFSMLFIFSVPFGLQAQNRVLIPMDESQSNHLKAYGVIFNHLGENESGQWLLNYRGGSFITTQTADIVRKSRVNLAATALIRFLRDD